MSFTQRYFASISKFAMFEYRRCSTMSIKDPHDARYDCRFEESHIYLSNLKAMSGFAPYIRTQ